MTLFLRSRSGQDVFSILYNMKIILMREEYARYRLLLFMRDDMMFCHFGTQITCLWPKVNWRPYHHSFHFAVAIGVDCDDP